MRSEVLFLPSHPFVASHTLQEKMCQLRKSYKYSDRHEVAIYLLLFYSALYLTFILARVNEQVFLPRASFQAFDGEYLAYLQLD